VGSSRPPAYLVGYTEHLELDGDRFGRRLLIYGEPVDAWTMLGAALIFAGNYWSVRRQMQAADPAPARPRPDAAS
jgi:hypothetical protein